MRNRKIKKKIIRIVAVEDKEVQNSSNCRKMRLKVRQETKVNEEKTKQSFFTKGSTN